MKRGRTCKKGRGVRPSCCRCITSWEEVEKVNCAKKTLTFILFEFSFEFLLPKEVRPVSEATPGENVGGGGGLPGVKPGGVVPLPAPLPPDAPASPSPSPSPTSGSPTTQSQKTPPPTAPTPTPPPPSQTPAPPPPETPKDRTEGAVHLKYHEYF